MTVAPWNHKGCVAKFWKLVTWEEPSSPGGSFYQFTYGPRCPIPRALLDRLGLKATRIGRALLNAPPAAVYRIWRQAPFRFGVWITFHWRGITSSVSVTSSPSFDSLAEPQQGQLSGAAITTCSRGRCSGKVCATVACARTSGPSAPQLARQPVRPRWPPPPDPPTAAPFARAAALSAPAAAQVDLDHAAAWQRS